jgi:hypothetical protein
MSSSSRVPLLARQSARLLAMSCACAGLFWGCRTADVVRINPGVAPERFRVVCRESFHPCRREAKLHCEGVFAVIEQHSNGPEPKAVETTGVSSTGPSEGAVGWRGEIVFQCGKAMKPVRLVRPDAPAATNAAEAPPVASTSAERVCVPGVTQACLGPGACSGAQACLPNGTAYGQCDCGAPAAPIAPPPAGTDDPADVANPAGQSTSAPPGESPRPEAAIDPTTSAASSSGAANVPSLPPSR